MKILHPLLQRFTQLCGCLEGHILPTECLLCGDTLKEGLLCDGCLYSLPWAQRHEYRCQQCAIAIESAGSFCGHCLLHPPAFSRSYIPFSYQHPLSLLIHRFKYRHKLEHGKLLAILFTQYINDCTLTHPDWLKPDVLIPTPMHWTRRWQRGFNHTEIIGQYLANTMGIPLVSHLVRRHERTPAQKELTRKERQVNLRKAFVISSKAQQNIIGKNIALIDDVVTTTATMRELSQQLINAGAKDVQVWALARTMEK